MFSRFLSSVILGLFLVLSTAVSAANDSQYKLASGDVIRINVFGEKDLSFDEVRLTDVGSFSYPFVGELHAKGKTAAQLERLITQKLKGEYLVDPRVSVSVLHYREFYIGGEVKNPGGYPFQPGLTLRRAVTLAGGLTERASEKRITIISDQDGAKSTRKGSLDSTLSPGDTITINAGFF